MVSLKHCSYFITFISTLNCSWLSVFILVMNGLRVFALVWSSSRIARKSLEVDWLGIGA